MEVFGREISLGWRVLLKHRTVWNYQSVPELQIQFSAGYPGKFEANVSQSPHTDLSGTVIFIFAFIFGTSPELVVYFDFKL